MLSGWPAGFLHPMHQLRIQVDPSGHVVRASDQAEEPWQPWPHLEFDDGSGAVVWIERPGPTSGNDMVTLERLAAGLRLTLERVSPVDLDDAGAIEILISATSTDDSRRKAARRLGLPADHPLRVVVADRGEPMPAGMRSAVVESAAGEIRAGVLADRQAARPASCGLGSAGTLHHLARSFDEALVAARLVSAASPVVVWDDLGVLGPLAASAMAGLGEHPDARAVAGLGAQEWGMETLDALVTTESVRAAAQALGLHHSTLQSRVRRVERELGFEVSSPRGRHRLPAALMVHRVTATHPGEDQGG
ncbi:MAG TPA: helix-turn-helix domain-containing protein [Actinotalea sp.]|nr:helix-turn-helix domain-containing protein [Actinotalea sp.]